jgi:hypothetical protein
MCHEGWPVAAVRANARGYSLEHRKVMEATPVLARECSNHLHVLCEQGLLQT